MKVHIHANCQAVLLAGMLNEVEPDWDISYFDVRFACHRSRYFQAASTSGVWNANRRFVEINRRPIR